MAKENIKIENLEKLEQAIHTVGITAENANKAFECLSQSLSNDSTEKPKQNWLVNFLNQIVDLLRKK